MATPAEGPSLGMAPAGHVDMDVGASKKSSSIPRKGARARM